MATAYTSLLGLALPVTGELSGTWGTTVNDAITGLLDTAVAGTTTLSSDADVTLSTTTGAANQARQAVILWTAGGSVLRTITAPAQSKSYIVINKTASTQSIKIVGVGPTTGVTVVAGTAALVAWNGVDFVTVSVMATTGILPVANGGTGAATLAGASIATYTGTETLTNKTLTNPTVNNYTEGVVAIGTVTTASTLALTNGTVQTATLTASTACTFTMPTATAGKSFVLLLKQAASTGNGTATFTSVKWGTAGAPTITATAGNMDILSFVSDGANWYGSAAQGYTP